MVLFIFILGGYIVFSMVDKLGLVLGMIGVYLVKEVNVGFIGGIIVGFIVGFVVL